MAQVRGFSRRFINFTHAILLKIKICIPSQQPFTNDCLYCINGTCFPFLLSYQNMNVMKESASNKTPQMMRNIFGVIMIIVYIGMGVLFFMNYFSFTGSWQILRWIGGVVFTIYGIWRAYRQFKGIDPDITSRS